MALHDDCTIVEQLDSDDLVKLMKEVGKVDIALCQWIQDEEIDGSIILKWQQADVQAVLPSNFKYGPRQRLWNTVLDIQKYAKSNHLRVRSPLVALISNGHDTGMLDQGSRDIDRRPSNGPEIQQFNLFPSPISRTLDHLPTDRHDGDFVRAATGQTNANAALDPRTSFSSGYPRFDAQGNLISTTESSSSNKVPTPPSTDQSHQSQRQLAGGDAAHSPPTSAPVDGLKRVTTDPYNSVGSTFDLEQPPTTLHQQGQLAMVQDASSAIVATANPRDHKRDRSQTSADRRNGKVSAKGQLQPSSTNPGRIGKKSRKLSKSNSAATPQIRNSACLYCHYVRKGCASCGHSQVCQRCSRNFADLLQRQIIPANVICATVSCESLADLLKNSQKVNNWQTEPFFGLFLGLTQKAKDSPVYSPLLGEVQIDAADHVAAYNMFHTPTDISSQVYAEKKFSETTFRLQTALLQIVVACIYGDEYFDLLGDTYENREYLRETMKHLLVDVFDFLHHVTRARYIPQLVKNTEHFRLVFNIVLVISAHITPDKLGLSPESTTHYNAVCWQYLTNLGKDLLADGCYFLPANQRTPETSLDVGGVPTFAYLNSKGREILQPVLAMMDVIDMTINYHELLEVTSTRYTKQQWFQLLVDHLLTPGQKDQYGNVFTASQEDSQVWW